MGTRRVFLQIRWQMWSRKHWMHLYSQNECSKVCFFSFPGPNIHSHSWSKGVGWRTQPYRFDGLVQGRLLQLQLALFILVKVIPTLSDTYGKISSSWTARFVFHCFMFDFYGYRGAWSTDSFLQALPTYWIKCHTWQWTSSSPKNMNCDWILPSSTFNEI